MKDENKKTFPLHKVDESKIDEDIKELVDAIKQSILNSSTYQEYESLKTSILQSKSWQKAFALEKYLHKCKLSKEEKKEYDKTKEEINSSPLINNFKIVESDLKNTLEEIKDILDLWSSRLLDQPPLKKVL